MANFTKCLFISKWQTATKMCQKITACFLRSCYVFLCTICVHQPIVWQAACSDPFQPSFLHQKYVGMDLKTIVNLYQQCGKKNKKWSKNSCLNWKCHCQRFSQSKSIQKMQQNLHKNSQNMTKAGTTEMDVEMNNKMDHTDHVVMTEACFDAFPDQF